MTLTVDHLLAAGVLVRVGGADAWAATRRLLGAGVRIGTEQQRELAARHACTCACRRLSHTEDSP